MIQTRQHHRRRRYARKMLYKKKMLAPVGKREEREISGSFRSSRRSIGVSCNIIQSLDRLYLVLEEEEEEGSNLYSSSNTMLFFYFTRAYLKLLLVPVLNKTSRQTL